MGMGRLNVWIHDSNSPCRISDEPWFVDISYCSGETLEWCGNTFGFLEAKCGHLDVEVPPGCYTVFASQFVLLKGFKFPLLRFTHIAIVVVECDSAACVHLYNPTQRQITRQAGDAGSILANEGGPIAADAKRLATAAAALLERLPMTGPDEALEQAIQEAASKAKRKGK